MKRFLIGGTLIMKKLMMLLFLALLLSSCRESHYGLAPDRAENLKTMGSSGVCDYCNFDVCDSMQQALPISCPIAQALSVEHFCTTAISLFWQDKKPNDTYASKQNTLGLANLREGASGREREDLTGNMSAVVEETSSTGKETNHTKPLEATVISSDTSFSRVNCQDFLSSISLLESNTNCGGLFSTRNKIFSDYMYYALARCGNLATNCDIIKPSDISEMVERCESGMADYILIPRCNNDEEVEEVIETEEEVCRELCKDPKVCKDGECVCGSFSVDSKDCILVYEEFETYLLYSGTRDPCPNLGKYVVELDNMCCRQYDEAKIEYDNFCGPQG